MTSKKYDKQKKPNKKSKVLTVSALAIVIIATIVAVYVHQKSKTQTAFFARSINDASYDCEDKIDSRFDEDLVSKYYDEISSRYEANKHQYVIYYRISVRLTENDLPVIKDYMAKCNVWEKLGYVSDFQVLDIL